eukprot:SAG11_NODE_2130_length_3778_cov_2.150584_1_plen_44_part_10
MSGLIRPTAPIFITGFVHYGFIVFSIEPIVAVYFRDDGVESFPW